MPEINASTIPGTVALPTWVLIVTIITLAGALSFTVRAWLKDKDAALATRGADVEKMITGLNAATVGMNSLIQTVQASLGRKTG